MVQAQLLLYHGNQHLWFYSAYVWPTIAHQSAILLSYNAAFVSFAAFTACYWISLDLWVGMVVTAAVFVAVVLSMFITHRKGQLPGSYAVPLFPFIPALSVGLNTFLLGALPQDAYVRFGIWTAAVTGRSLLVGLSARLMVQQVLIGDHFFVPLSVGLNTQEVCDLTFGQCLNRLCLYLLVLQPVP
eukprot:GHRR01026612.1.p1 GENE.GHRR01026612.1~~GHRR01026612.1.p1  ORF type:complete len:186 (-),score=25.11 GHRR01026612.1:360-917(-)